MAEKKRLDELYLAYGKFVTRFELGCQLVRMMIGEAVGFSINVNVVDIRDVLLEGLTAKPLIDKLYGVYVFLYPNRPEVINRVKQMRKLFVELIEVRNTLSHGVINPNDLFGSEKKEVFRLTHHKIKSNGFDENLKEITPEKIGELVENIDNLLLCISYVSALPDPIYPNQDSLIAEIDKRLPIIRFILN